MGLRFEGIRKDYGAQRVLAEMDLTVIKGEFLTLLGPSGSGKTTTLMVAAGLTPATQGRVWLGGTDITSLPPHRRNIGIVFQNFALFPHKTAEENIAFPLRMRRVPRSETRDRVNRALELVRLEGLGHRYPRQLSGGQQQRVALARALVFEPDLVLMDEPLGALDRKLRNEMQAELKRLDDELDLTVVYVTHDQDEALSMSDRVAVMRDGVIEQIGSPSEIYARPATQFVASFVGDRSLLRGRLSTNGARTELELSAGKRLVLRDGIGSDAGLGNVTIAIQAEQVRLEGPENQPHPSTDEDEVTLDGTVESVLYFGGGWRMELQISSGERLRGIWRENGVPVPPRGARVTAVWRLKDAWIVNRPEE